MPYKLVGNCVYKGEEKLKCYDNRKDAVAYFRALQANVKDSLQEFSMFISKASLHDGVMRWSAINSDTDWDLYGERMSLELYKSMLVKIKSNTPPPEHFADFVTSDYWKGGMPYLSIAHYSDGNGKAVPGDVKELFIDGNQLKAKGTLHNTPLGKAVWKSLKEDEVNYKNDVDTDRIRISIAFLDLAHKHGEQGKVFRRNALTDMCPECRRGVGEKIYLDGYLVHLALTRVPVNPRTIMEAEDELMAKRSKPTTKLEDAKSVIGDSVLAEEVANANLEVKSLAEDALVEMSDAEPEQAPVSEPPVIGQEGEVKVFTVTKEELKSLVSELVEASMKSKEKVDEEDMEEDEKDEDYKPKKSDTVSMEKSTLEKSVENLYTVVNAVVSRAGTSDDKLKEVQPALEALGQEIVAVVRASVGEVTPTPAPVNDAVLEAIQELKSYIQSVDAKVATMEVKSLSTPPPADRVPAPRSINPAVTKSAVPQAPENTNSVKSIVRRSVGL